MKIKSTEILKAEKYLNIKWEMKEKWKKKKIKVRDELNISSVKQLIVCSSWFCSLDLVFSDA